MLLLLNSRHIVPPVPFILSAQFLRLPLLSMNQNYNYIYEYGSWRWMKGFAEADEGAKEDARHQLKLESLTFPILSLNC